MKLVLSLLGVVLLVVAAVYFLMPADQLPGFMPGHEAGVTRVHSKHGIVAGAAGIVLLVAGWSAQVTAGKLMAGCRIDSEFRMAGEAAATISRDAKHARRCKDNPRKEEGAGNAGCWPHPQPRAQR